MQAEMTQTQVDGSAFAAWVSMVGRVLDDRPSDGYSLGVVSAPPPGGDPAERVRALHSLLQRAKQSEGRFGYLLPMLDANIGVALRASGGSVVVDEGVMLHPASLRLQYLSSGDPLADVRGAPPWVCVRYGTLPQGQPLREAIRAEECWQVDGHATVVLGVARMTESGPQLGMWGPPPWVWLRSAVEWTRRSEEQRLLPFRQGQLARQQEEERRRQEWRAGPASRGDVEDVQAALTALRQRVEQLERGGNGGGA
jgi:hypothetical protein